MNNEQFKLKYDTTEHVFGYVNVKRIGSPTKILDDQGRTNGWDYDNLIPTFEVYLDHSCDEWIIGGENDAQEMIGDLQKALEYIKSIKEKENE